MQTTVELVVHTKEGIAAQHSVVSNAGASGSPLIIKAQDNVTYELKDTATNVAPDRILMKRAGKNLEISLDVDGHTGEASEAADIVVEDYYDASNARFVGGAEDGQFYSYAPVDGESSLLASEMSDGDYSYQALGYTDVSPIPWWYGLPLLGLLFIGGGSGGGGDDDSREPLTAPSVKIVLDTNNDGTIDGTEKGSATTTDVLIGIPSGSEAGDVITVTDNNGAVLATYTVGSGAGEVAAGSTQTITNVALPVDANPIVITAAIHDAKGNAGPSGADSAIANVAPVTAATNTALLDLIGLEALGLLDLSNQAAYAADVNNNIRAAGVQYQSVVSVVPYELAASQALADELGLTIEVYNDPGLLGLGLLLTTSVLVIRSADGGPIDNVKLNELLLTLRFADSDLNAEVGDILTVEAVDMDGLRHSTTVSDLLNVSLLQADHGTGAGLMEGTAGDDITDGSSTTDYIFGLGGNDTLSGLEGDDLINGGEGNDLIHGGDGHDILIGGNGTDALYGDAGDDAMVYDADDVIGGGAGTDTLHLFGNDIHLDLTVIANTKITGIEIIDMTGNGDNTLALNYTDLLALSDTDTLYVIGNGGDTVTLSGEVFTGSAEIDGVIYNTYNIGGTSAADIWVHQEIAVL